MELPTSETYTYHYNGIGSTIAMTDQSQTIINTYNYEPFGKLSTESETIPQSFKYVGQHGVMSETNGLLFMRARYFDADTGRFISEDPIGFGGKQTNLYAYVGNNPINAIDPFGLKASTGGSNTLGQASRLIAGVGAVIGGGAIAAGAATIGPAVGGTALLMTGMLATIDAGIDLSGSQDLGPNQATFESFSFPVDKLRLEAKFFYSLMRLVQMQFIIIIHLVLLRP